MRARVALLVSLAIVATASCDSLEAPDAERDVEVVATTPVLADLARELLGDDAAIRTLVPRTGDPHQFDLAEVEAPEVAGAKIVLVNGGGLEPGLDEFLAAVAALDDPPTVFEAMAHVTEPILTPEGVTDPHFWHDPGEVAAVGHGLAEALADAGVIDDLGEIERAARELDLDLAGVRFEAGELLDAVPERRRGLVTHHEFFRYFARAYGFTVIGTVVAGPSSVGETSASHELNLTQTIEEREICAIFTGLGSGESLSDVVAEQADVEVVVVEVHADTLPPDVSLRQSMLENARIVARTLTTCE